MSSVSLKEWRAIMRAVEAIERGEAQQIKNKQWTVYQTASCIRIDIFPPQGE